MIDGESTRNLPEPSLVVGVGASAGGLDAYKRLLAALPDATEMSFILVQHLDPRHKSLLAELLAPRTALRVCEARHDARVEPNVIYVITPNTELSVRGGRIQLTSPTLHQGIRLPIDHLFRSLGREYGHRAVGIVLSGAGSDGVPGLRDIKAAGGLTIAQDPSTASQTGMPTSAIDAGLIDLVLDIADMPAALQRYERLPPVTRLDPPEQVDPEGHRPSGLSDAALQRFIEILQANQGFDPSVYRQATLERRILRRMTLSGFEDIDRYLDVLNRDADQQHSLVRDMLISVTDFFRDPDAFDALRSLVIEPLVASADGTEPLRIWVPGCATGEEPYSIAMEFLDVIDREHKRVPLQIFASDVDTDALGIARIGAYPHAAVEHISPARLDRYFVSREPHGVQVRPRVRDAVSFSEHDVCVDPPFSRLHLISFRNVLIYLRPAAQDHVLKVMHFALKPDGHLMLGPSESISRHPTLFSIIAKQWRIYRKVGNSRSLSISSGASRRLFRNREEPPAPRSAPSPTSSGDFICRVLTRACIPACMVVSGEGNVIYTSGDLSGYLRFPEGDPTLELSAIVTAELATRVQAMVYRCRRSGQPTQGQSTVGETSRPTRIRAYPTPDLGEGAVAITFEPTEEHADADAPPADIADARMIAQLEQELQATREDLRNTVEELESANQELRSSNEESMSMNEELQSTNEELEATTEELRSLNEELRTVNTQLRDKLDLLEQAHDDLANFFSSTKIATVFLDEELRIARFTPAAGELLDIDSSAEGRLVSDVARPLLQDGLFEQARRVLNHLTSERSELRTPDGRWISRGVLPYRTQTRRIEGVVITLVDISELKEATESLAIREHQQAVIARLGLLALEDSENQTFLELVVRDVSETLGTELCAILELEPRGKSMLLRASVGWTDEQIERASAGLSLDSEVGYTLHAHGPVIVDDVSRDRRFQSAQLLGQKVVSGISCTIRGGELPYGVLRAHSTEHRAFTYEDTNFIQAVCTIVAAALSRYQVRIQRALEAAYASALAVSRDLHSTITDLFDSFAREVGPSVGELWYASRDNGLRRTLLLTTSPYERAEVERQLAGKTAPSGDSSLRRVFERQRSQWLSLLEPPRPDPHLEHARRLGLRSGLMLPIVVADTVLGVVSLLTSARVTVSPAFLRSLDALGRSIGESARRTDVEAQLRRLAAIVEAAQDAIMSLTFDGVVDEWLQGAERLYGYSAARMRGSSIEQIVPEDQRPKLREMIARVRNGEQIKPFETTGRCHDGRIVHVSTRLSPIHSADGSVVIGLSKIDRDISARKQAEQRLQESEWRFRRVLLNSPVPMLVCDEGGDVVAISDSWIQAFGYSSEETPTLRLWSERVFGDRAPQILQHFERLWVTEDPDLPRVDATTKDGTQRSLMLSGASLGRQADGRTLRICATTDITRQTNAERELLEASRQKDEFLAMLGHELRNPLAAVHGAVRLPNFRDIDDPAVQEARAILERQTSHMTTLLDGLLDVSRIIRGKIQLTPEIVDLRPIVADVVRTHAQAIEDKQLTLREQVAPEELWTYGDPVRLTQIVENLLSNAVKYTDQGSITVALGRERADAVLTVTDTGIGIEPELLPRIFDSFQQAQQSLHRSRGGLGLGLALVYSLVNLHNGHVEAHSEGAGKGARLTVRLPLTDARPAAESPRPSPATRSSRTKVLVIEDEIDLARVFRRVLEASGHEVEVAHDGIRGQEIAQRWLPDIVLCDIGLPRGVSGYDVARTLRSDPTTAGIALAAVTGYGRREDAVRARESGFDAHLTKPVDLDALEAVIARLLGRVPSS